MSKTVPLKTTVSKEQKPLLPSPIKTACTQRGYTGGLDIIDEFCSLDREMPQVAVAPKTAVQDESVRIVSLSSFLIFIYQFVACKYLKLTSCHPSSYFIRRTSQMQ